MAGAEGLNLTYQCNKDKASFQDIVHLNLVWGSSGILTFILSSGILMIIVFYKAHKTVLQRMLLYLTVFTMLYLAVASFSLQLQPNFFRHTGEKVCRFTGYIQSSVYICTLIISLEISVYLLYVMHCQLRGKKLPVLKRPHKVGLEFACLLIAVIMPLSLLATNYKDFGVSGVICWIRLYRDNCSIVTNSVVPVKMLFSSYMILSVANLVAFAALVYIFLRLACSIKQTRRTYLKTAKNTGILLCILIISTTIHLSSILFPYLLIFHELPIKASMVFICLFTPLAQLFQPLAYLFYINSIKKFSWSVAKGAAGEWKMSWMKCCMKASNWLGSSDNGRVMLINNLDDQSTEYLTPTPTSQYGSVLDNTLSVEHRKE